MSMLMSRKAEGSAPDEGDAGRVMALFEEVGFLWLDLRKAGPAAGRAPSFRLSLCRNEPVKPHDASHPVCYETAQRYHAPRDAAMRKNRLCGLSLERMRSLACMYLTVTQPSPSIV